jgi:phosphate:Na+ symporter
MVMQNGAETFPYIKRGIAIAHTGFNLANTIIFLPLVPLLARVVMRLVPDAADKEVPHLTYLDIRMIDAGAMGIEESNAEIIKMGDHVNEMMAWLGQILAAKEVDEDLVRKTFHREEVLDILQKEITEFLGHLLSGNVAREVTETARRQLRMADEYESLGDYITNVLKLYLKKRKSKIWFSDESWQEVLVLHKKVESYLSLINEAVRENRPEVLSKANTSGDAITHEMKEYRARHLERVGTEQASPLASLIFTDMLNAYRRLKDHGLNIAEALAGEK